MSDTKRKKKKKKKKLEPMDGMLAPNHAASFDLSETLDAEITAPHEVKYPLLHLSVPDSQGSGQPHQLAFVGAPYNCVKWLDRSSNATPTWMDPEVFVRQLKKTSPEIFKQAESIVKSKNHGRSKLLVEPLTKAFEEVYVPYAQKMFNRAAPVLAEWIVAHVAVQLGDMAIEESSG